MIRVIMLGRLGNNLFQYALGRALSEKHGVPLILDASWFNARTWRYVEPLSRLPGITSGKAVISRPFSTASRALRKLTGRHHWEFLGKPVIREKEDDHTFDVAILQSPPDCVLFGYFQSHLYFEDIGNMLRGELSTAGLGLEAGFEKTAAELRKPNSVAVHVRRTDYIGNRNLACCGPAYYRKAMDRMRERIDRPRFHVFSDEPGWCLENLSAKDVVITGSGDPFQPLVDLHLMGLAGHHIIANSSYSWWAAWLGAKPGQQVVMPGIWFNSGIRAPIGEKRPPGWHMLDCQ